MCRCVGAWVRGCVGVWVCECVGVFSVWVCGCVGVWVWVCGCVGGVATKRVHHKSTFPRECFSVSPSENI